MIYIPKPGDKVQIISKVTSEPGWDNSWEKSMNDYVGDGVVYVVSTADKTGVRLNGVSWTWPPGSLGLVGAAAPINVGDYVKVVRKTNTLGIWVSELNQYVNDGNSYRVMTVMEGGKYGRLETCNNSPSSNDWNFPFDALERQPTSFAAPVMPSRIEQVKAYKSRHPHADLREAVDAVNAGWTEQGQNSPVPRSKIEEIKAYRVRNPDASLSDSKTAVEAGWTEETHAKAPKGRYIYNIAGLDLAIKAVTGIDISSDNTNSDRARYIMLAASIHWRDQRPDDAYSHALRQAMLDLHQNGSLMPQDGPN